MKRFPAIPFLLLLAAACSGVLNMNERFRLCRQWQEAPAEIREEMLLGMFGPAIHSVRAVVPEHEGLLLFSAVDPALLPYALFPRKIWQVQTDPETNYIYMDLPLSPYGQVEPISLPVTWVLDIHNGNIIEGGELTRLRPTDGSQ